jgi:hypothetical protein
MDTTLEPKLILKYVFKSTPKNIDLYSNFYNLIQLYNSSQFIDYIELYYSITINSGSNNNNFLYFILYSQIFKYIKPKKNILNILTSKIITENLNNIHSIYKYMYCYTLKQVNASLFIHLRDALILGTIVYFQILYNKLCYLKDIVTKEHIDKLVTFNNINDIDNYIIQLVFKKKKCLFLTTDSKLISILMGVSNKIIVKHYKNQMIHSNVEFIKIRDSIITKNIESSDPLFSDKEINIILQNFNIINPNKLFLHILNLYFDTFLISFISKRVIDKIVNNIETIFNKNDRHSITLRKFKDYFIDPSFKE